jgi:hypothetical protein
MCLGTMLFGGASHWPTKATEPGRSGRPRFPSPPGGVLGGRPGFLRRRGCTRTHQPRAEPTVFKFARWRCDDVLKRGTWRSPRAGSAGLVRRTCSGGEQPRSPAFRDFGEGQNPSCRSRYDERGVPHWSVCHTEQPPSLAQCGPPVYNGVQPDEDTSCDLAVEAHGLRPHRPSSQPALREWNTAGCRGAKLSVHSHRPAGARRKREPLLVDGRLRRWLSGGYPRE